MSGIHFVDTLSDAEQFHFLFGKGGVAERLAPCFNTRKGLLAGDLVDFYNELVAMPIVLRMKDRVTVSRYSYNSMDFLRAFNNVMQTVHGATRFEFYKALWDLMLRCQARPRETRARLEHFHVDMNKANQLLRTFAQLNWTTLLVALCEIRQARGTTVEENVEFDRMF